jgi:hypothetical protein
MARDHLKDQSDAADEQTGLVTNFIADSALEGAGVEVPEKGADEDYIVRAAPAVDPLGFNGGGGGGGGGGAGGWPGSEGIGDEGSNDEGDGDEGKPEEKQEKGRIGKLVDKVLKRDTAEQKPQTKPDPKAPEKPKKPDGDR